MMGELTGWMGTQIAGVSPLAGVASLAISCLTVAAAIGLFSHSLPKRRGYALRGAAVLLASTVLFGAAGGVAGVVGNTVGPEASYVIAFALYSLLLAAYIAGVLAVYETTVWTAIFCATSGYTIQNLASGSMELGSSVLRACGANPGDPLAYALLYGACVAVVFLGAYHLLAKRIDREGLAQVESRSMVAMMPVVSLVIIGFDVMVKAMEGAGLSLGFVALLRLFHGIACAITLWVEYQLLFRQRLEQDREVADEAYPGDIIGLFDPGIFGIGDTVCTGKPIRFDGIPMFAPEIFARVHTSDTMKRKQFIKGVTQLAQEGAIQIFKENDIGIEEIIVGVVGQLQLEVLAYRLKNEYNVEPSITNLPYRFVRWVLSRDIDPKTLRLSSSCRLAQDNSGRPVILFENDWSIRWALENNKGLQLTDSVSR